MENYLYFEKSKKVVKKEVNIGVFLGILTFAEKRKLNKERELFACLCR